MQITAPLNIDLMPALQRIEVASFFQIPSFQIIGLPSPEVAEARERIKAAILASGLEFPRRRVIVNLSPASVPKRGTGLDLAMALAILGSSEEKPEADRFFGMAWGELGLDGQIKPVGQLTRAIHAAWNAGIPFLVLARAEYSDALERLRWIRESGELKGPPPTLVPVASLEEAWGRISRGPISPKETGATHGTDSHEPDGRNLLPLPRAMERVAGITASGAHHLLLLGPRGTGKSHLLEWLVALQAPIPPTQRVLNALVAELSPSMAQISNPKEAPARRVSSQVRPSALTGGIQSQAIRPGEFSLAHGGLLIADEFPEWARDSREALREPLERGLITVTRAQGRVELPARFTLAANGNLCPCGGWPPQLPLPPSLGRRGRKIARCRCNLSARQKYLARISGPVLDRLDLACIVSTPDLGPRARAPNDNLQGFQNLRVRCNRTRERLQSTWGALPGLLSAREIEAILQRSPSWLECLERLSGLSLRGRHKTASLALTLAAWDEQDCPTEAHFIEASCYRPERFGLYF